MAFSGALTLTDLNDFITPAQACIKPVEQTTAIPEKDPGGASTEIQIDSTGAYYEVNENGNATNTAATNGNKLEQASISLVDCLACSGCITSAESILITLQSHTEVLDFLHSNNGTERKVPVISISPQTLASLSASISNHHPTTPRQILRRLQLFLTQSLGFEHVFDTSFARHLALKEHVREYLERKAAASASTTTTSQLPLPMLASACPGWICYAEKAHPEMLPFIATTKSPQQVMGTLVKRWMGEQWGRSPNGIYHVSVMPCYDKKLEASRTDFYNEAHATRDVDCVITTGELDLLLRSKGWDLRLPVPNELGDPPSSSMLLPELLTHSGTSSGSYLHAILTEITNISPSPLTLSVKTIRNTDYEEYTLVDPNGSAVFKGAKCYGFRNLQNVVRKVGRDGGVRTGKGGAAGRLGGRVGGAGGIKARLGARAALRKGGKDVSSGEGKETSTVAAVGNKAYDYVEVMACPGGCVNGGGQLKPPGDFAMSSSVASAVDAEGYARDWEQSGVLENAKWGDKEWTKRVERAYWDGKKGSEQEEEADQLVGKVLQDLKCVDDGNEEKDGEVEGRRRELFRTAYRVVESEVVGLAVKW